MSNHFWGRHPGLKRAVLTPFSLLYRMNNRVGLSATYFFNMKRRLNLENPRSLNEKIQWLKLYHRDPLYATCADKYAMRGYVRGFGHGDLLVDLLWVGDRPEDIPFDDLPDKFVLKTTHGCGYNIVCRDKATLDRAAAVRRLKKWQREKYIECYGEWFYGVEPVRIICERYIEGPAEDELPWDYKVLCFGGDPRIIQLDMGRFQQGQCRNFYDTGWNLLPFRQTMPNGAAPVEKPSVLEEMLRSARRISAAFPFVRLDYYVSGGRLYLGEITLSYAAGFSHFEPEHYNTLLGDWITLPEKTLSAAHPQRQ